MSALRGIDWYVQTARLRATTIVEDVRWFAVFDPEHPHSHDGNQLVVHQSTEIDLASVADEYFADAPHLAITTFADIPVSSVLDLQGAGFRRTDFLIMTADPRDVGPVDTDVDVVEVTEDESAVFAKAIWRVEQPEYTDEVTAELVDRRKALDLAGRVHRLAVRDSGTVVATCDVVVRDTTAELDAVAVDPERRQRGIGDALVATAGEIARRSGVDLLVLTALAADWPREWYSRRGFEEVATEQSFVLDVR
jgi:ribosomal protein S18 acetylase RimI-like enzyme